MPVKQKPDPVFLDILRKSGSTNQEVARAAMVMLAQAFETPLRKDVLDGDIVKWVYDAYTVEPGTNPEYPLDLIGPGEAEDFVAFTTPGYGYSPTRLAQGTYVTIPTEPIANKISWTRRMARDAQYNIVNRLREVFMAGFTTKINRTGWHTILAAGADRNVMVYDADASTGQFTKRLVSLMMTYMRRNGGGNSTSVNRAKLTDLFLSPENLEDIRNWGVDQIDEITRRDIFMNEGKVTRIFGVNLHDLDELGVNQEFQKFFTDQLGASITGSDNELLVGLDLEKSDSFVMPVREEFFLRNSNMDDEGMLGLYGEMEHGFGVLDQRRVILGSC